MRARRDRGPLQCGDRRDAGAAGRGARSVHRHGRRRGIPPGAPGVLLPPGRLGGHRGPGGARAVRRRHRPVPVRGGRHRRLPDVSQHDQRQHLRGVRRAQLRRGSGRPGGLRQPHQAPYGQRRPLHAAAARAPAPRRGAPAGGPHPCAAARAGAPDLPARAVRRGAHAPLRLGCGARRAERQGPGRVGVAGDGVRIPARHPGPGPADRAPVAGRGTCRRLEDRPFLRV